MITLEDKIIINLLFNNEFATKIIPFLKKEYFNNDNAVIIDSIRNFYNEYNAIPTPDELKIELLKLRSLSDKTLKAILEQVESYRSDDCDPNWLYKNAEKFFQEKSLENAIIEGARILSSEPEKRGNILSMVQDALGVSFDTNIGHDYFADATERFESYHSNEEKISLGIKALDRITNGGLLRKTLNCIIAPTGSGKTLFMCSLASNVVKAGYNVLYITMEIAEHKIAERIDANLMSNPIESIKRMDLKNYSTSIQSLRKRVMGNLIIKEYPTSGASCSNFRSLLNDLRLKKGFIPDLIVVDYMNICASNRVRPNQTNSYGLIKAISEELRSLAIEFKVALLTATQTNRNGVNNSDIELTDISESFGSTHVMDLNLAMIRTPELDDQNQVMIKQLKNRYDDMTKEPFVILGLNRTQMKVYDLDNFGETLDNAKNTGFVKKEYRPVEMPKEIKTQAEFETLKKNGKNDFSNFQF